MTTAGQAPTIVVPDPSLVLLIGVTGSGKSTFAARHFRPTQVLSSDAFRALVADDENDQEATADAFELLHRAVDRRLARHRLTVVDATNVQASARRPLLDAARDHLIPAVAVVFDLPARVTATRNAARAGRTVPAAIHQRQGRALRRSLQELPREGFAAIWLLRSPEAIDRTIVGSAGS
ncbi:MAG TPA: AAA family ATPase [Candidatus Sulfotelmatobacter sp.]|nr:AAA family ATPase [Candidatus Sulfotelmatobacter sp.]